MAAAPPLRTGNPAAPPAGSALRAASHVPDNVDASARKKSGLERPTRTRATAAAATSAPLAPRSAMAANSPLRTGDLASPPPGSALRATARPPDSADAPARRKSKPKRPSTQAITTAATPAATLPQRRHRPTEPSSAESATLLMAPASPAPDDLARRRPGSSRATTTQAPAAAATPAPKLSPATVVCLLPALVAMPPLSWLDSFSRRLISGIVSTITTPGTLATAPPIMPIALCLLIPALVATSVVGALAEVAVDLLGIYLISILRWQAPRAIYQRYETAHHPARRHPITKLLLGLAWTLRFAILVSLLGLFEAAKLLALGAQRLALKLQKWSTPLEQLPPTAANHLRLHNLRPSQTISRSTFKIHQQRRRKKPRHHLVIPWLAASLRAFTTMSRSVFGHVALRSLALSSSTTHILRDATNTAITATTKLAQCLFSLLPAIYRTIRDAIHNNFARSAADRYTREEDATTDESATHPSFCAPCADATTPISANESTVESKPDEPPCLLSENEQTPSPCPHPRVKHSRKRRHDQLIVYNVVAPEMRRQPTPAQQHSTTSYYAALTSAIAVLRNRRSLPCRILPFIAAPSAITIRCWDALQQPSYYFPEDNVIKWAPNFTFR